MKELLLVLVLTLVLFMSGCGENELRKTDEYYCENDYDGTWNELLKQCDYNYYTQEEVDDMFNHLYDVVLPALENALIDNYLLIEQYEDDIDEILDYYDIKIAELQLQIDELGE